ncbi:PorV/PorQ family protein [candidate division KSB1 bacterium]|nr:PorV/PorQ family protein [candidate division KSB1 bacterium]NIR71034.1 PorV/PorQ family protein [candidate division KSB1 bacterium]NIS26119.1 PorV/PorQ family protein [candidate division KSB1 bacterium]NIT72913.1 PorV/PorQ family protein [candidate division KSB1 bacterium]NIU26758.1 PorV/PorQ family protein [candidate division KSB1 bacterium]
MRSVLSFIILPAIICLLFVNPGSGQTGGGTGLAFLKVGVGGRAGGMGEAFTAVADDATATFWNPAGLSYVPKTQLAFTHTEWIQDISSEFVAFAFPALKGSVGLSIYSNNVGGIERRVQPSEEPLGTVDANDIAFGVSYGHAFSSRLSGGITIKYLYEKIFIESAAGFAADFGLSLRPFENDLTVAITAQNLGSMGTLKDESIDLPTTVRVGASYRLPLPSLEGDLLLAADAVNVRDTDLRGNLGAELQLQRLFAFRFGYQTGFDDKSVGGGLGVLFKKYRLDYGFASFGSNLGDTHRISIGLEL